MLERAIICANAPSSIEEKNRFKLLTSFGTLLDWPYYNIETFFSQESSLLIIYFRN